MAAPAPAAAPAGCCRPAVGWAWLWSEWYRSFARRDHEAETLLQIEVHRLLVVSLLCRLLRRNGYDVITAASCSEGVDVIGRHASSATRFSPRPCVPSPCSPSPQ